MAVPVQKTHCLCNSVHNTASLHGKLPTKNTYHVYHNKNTFCNHHCGNSSYNIIDSRMAHPTAPNTPRFHKSPQIQQATPTRILSDPLNGLPALRCNNASRESVASIIPSRLFVLNGNLRIIILHRSADHPIMLTRPGCRCTHSPGPIRGAHLPIDSATHRYIFIYSAHILVRPK